ncbi:histidine kinase [Vibrio sp. 10N.286.49.C2]|uniref:hybrid sensor histidine kinase/response regulator n=1 Tax=unclassified Vibrio TaxID=2614977 RepID=UPI000C83AA89|nr:MULTISPECIES: hybrid sensor histidine kinase/response regulator [unclassified Vibrio]PMH37706.1 histidine kinase [Vibrio sp. 10N.286.49.C2]PMH45129.1 histidine kinase [Vibrio sp. 10N.286.49.B1]PMH79086.1 histidine kinase [Vibrio sp. 10N.286.48.B7]
MLIRKSLKKKSIVALTIYLAIFLAVFGSIAYWAVESPVREKLEENLDIKNEFLASEISAPLHSSAGVLKSIVGIGQAIEDTHSLDLALRQIFKLNEGIVVSGGLWPEPYSIDDHVRLSSLFYNRTAQGEVDKINLWNNPEADGYNVEPWYTSVIGQPANTIAWSEVYIDPYTHVQMITASSPYYIDDKFAGVATVDLSLDNLIRFVKRKAQERDLGIVVRDANKQVITEYNFRVSRDIYTSKRTFGDFDWHLEVVNARHLVADQVFDIVMSVELGILPVLLACVMFGYYLINQYLIKPITIIAKKADASRQGGNIDMRYESPDEIRYLIDSFNQKTVYLEQERIKAQASTQAKTAFLATLSHEIRTPMNGVLGTAQLLLKSELSIEQRKHLKTLYDSGDHMMVLLNEILDYSKIEQGHLELERSPFPLSSIIGSIHSVYHTLCNEKGLTFNVHSDVDDSRWYEGDKARLRQVLFNLLNNAIKFTPEGKVDVYFSEQLQQEPQQNKNILKITVVDTGIGISPQAQQRIFKPFEQAESSTTRRFGGTGLGLAIVREIVLGMDGNIVLKSEEGQGSRFDISLQLDCCEPQSDAIHVERKMDYSGLKVLIVEDNRTNTIIIEAFMRRKGFSTFSVVNGELALSAITEQRYDLVLMDNHMPVMDGVDAIAGIRAMESSEKDTLIFGCTADVFKETRERMLAAGADVIIAKPIDELVLDDALYQHAKKLFQFQGALPVKASSNA